MLQIFAPLAMTLAPTAQAGVGDAVIPWLYQPSVQLLLMIPLIWWLGRTRRGPSAAMLVPLPLWLLGVAAADEPRDPFHTGEFAGSGGAYRQNCGGHRQYGTGGVRYRYTTPLAPLDSEAWAEGSVYLGVDAGDHTAVHGGTTAMVGLDHRFAGAGAGMTAGALFWDGDFVEPVVPAGTLRLGPRDMIFAEGSFAHHSPGAFPAPIVKLGAGVAFPELGNEYQPLVVRGGISDAGFYLAPSIGLGRSVSGEAFVAVGDAETSQVSLAVRVHAPAR